MLLRIGIFFILYFSIGCGGGSYNKSDVERRFQEVQSIAKVGMPFEEAKDKLEKAGYRVSQKVAPRLEEDSFVSHVPLTETIPAQSTLADVTGKGTGPRLNAVFYIDGEGIITKVE
jgi:hypothetical protein